ncbi:hypothetical protein HYFRA_00011540 [Hymenoscyphus fraxineus]|uniref:Uncharacterized protein n=1 Tax=Hymenoscyphus fraxineus TaxID=746836 RepID=A0A9N9L5V4_9HELO|nr:hypothetical protein HYFRA_00011540 [Hymenoscyphus fraxineus]
MNRGVEACCIKSFQQRVVDKPLVATLSDAIRESSSQCGDIQASSSSHRRNEATSQTQMARGVEGYCIEFVVPCVCGVVKCVAPAKQMSVDGGNSKRQQQLLPTKLHSLVGVGFESISTKGSNKQDSKVNPSRKWTRLNFFLAECVAKEAGPGSYSTQWVSQRIRPLANPIPMISLNKKPQESGIVANGLSAQKTEEFLAASNLPYLVSMDYLTEAKRLKTHGDQLSRDGKYTAARSFYILSAWMIAE